MTNDKGQNWYATIIDRGYGFTLCEGFQGIGSCCFVDVDGDYDCVEYLTEAECAAKSGTFNLFRACGTTCGPVAICCSNGNCVEGIEREECLYFNGKYYTGLECTEQYDSSVGNDVRICYNSDNPPTVCCTGGTCISDVTFTVCAQYYGGTPLFGTCCNVNCAATPPRNIIGACCVDSSNTCSIQTPAGCSALGGVFYGDGTTCSGDSAINCCFDAEVPKYTCCLPDGSCLEQQTETQCLAAGGSTSNAENCVTANCPQPPVSTNVGLCCGQSKQWTSISKAECLQKDPNAYFYPNPIVGARVHAPYEWKEGSTLPDGSVTGGDCIFCDLARKTAKVAGITNSDFGVPNATIEILCTTNRKWLPNQTPGYLSNITDINLNENLLSSLKTKSTNLDLEIGNFNNTAYSIKHDSCCGYIEENNNELMYCMYDPFTIGHIFDQKAEGVGSSIQYSPSGLPWNPTQQQIKSFIFDQYLKQVNYPLADFKEKICRGKCSSWDIQYDGSAAIECGCNQTIECLGETTVGNVCQVMKNLIQIRLACSQCLNTSACQSTSPPPPVAFSDNYCDNMLIGYGLDSFVTIPKMIGVESCDISCENITYGKRCSTGTVPCAVACSNMDCSGDLAVNPCINLPSC
jgi:hypothetical protein